MTTRHLPTLEALAADDDACWTAELHLLEAREQVARARALLEDAERLVPDPEDPAFVAGAVLTDGPELAAAEFAAQLAQLGLRMVAVASALRRFGSGSDERERL